MEKEQDSNNVKDFLIFLDDLDKKNSFNVHIPSLNKEVVFKQLTTIQLKKILKSIIDSPIYNTEFTLTLNDIIKENCLDKDVNTEHFTIYDKLLIIFEFKTKSISSDFNFVFTDEEVEEYDLKEREQKVNISKHFKKFLEKNYSFSAEEFTKNGCTIKCDLPLIKTENKLEKELHKNINIEIKNSDELREAVGETFINEIVKFISTVSVNDKTINLLDLSFRDRIKLVESLPTSSINSVIHYIETYKNTTKELLTCIITTTNKNNEVVHFNKDIPLDGSFFNI